MLVQAEDQTSPWEVGDVVGVVMSGGEAVVVSTNDPHHTHPEYPVKIEYDGEPRRGYIEKFGDLFAWIGDRPSFSAIRLVEVDATDWEPSGFEGERLDG